MRKQTWSIELHKSKKTDLKHRITLPTQCKQQSSLLNQLSFCTLHQSARPSQSRWARPLVISPWISVSLHFLPFLSICTLGPQTPNLPWFLHYFRLRCGYFAVFITIFLAFFFGQDLIIGEDTYVQWRAWAVDARAEPLARYLRIRVDRHGK